ncbi:hypothetical protein [Moraxella porci]|uniref:hypothetical protein n=1 Tax=Moraxella porci TaxID=1288392 RepID=UPI002448F6DA|nr:hypothetical protein [Moraxella porci]MDH2274552.1 hypothetical protein [Moraxella porci]
MSLTVVPPTVTWVLVWVVVVSLLLPFALLALTVKPAEFEATLLYQVICYNPCLSK